MTKRNLVSEEVSAYH